MTLRLAITPGEPAGIGPDLVLALSQQDWPVELVICANQQLLLQTLDLQWQSQLGANQQFQLASTLWRTDPQQPASATSKQKLEFSEAYWSIDEGNWSFSAGKRKRDFDVNYGLRPLDLFSTTDTFAL